MASAWIIEVERPRKPILDAILAYLKQKDFCRYMLDEGHCAVFDFIARDLGARPSFLLLYRDYAAFSASDRYVAILGIATAPTSSS